MRAEFHQSSRLSGSLRVPASKSYTHRAYLTAALLAGGQVEAPLDCEDTRATLGILGALGAVCDDREGLVEISAGDPPKLTEQQLQVGESGTLLRFLLPLCSILPGPEQVILKGAGTLRKRSNTLLLDSLRENGLKIEGESNAETVPITCYPGQSLPDSPVQVTAETTSQLVSGWLLALAARGGGQLNISGPVVSSPYIEMTARVLQQAGVEVVQPRSGVYVVESGAPQFLDYSVPGDYSSAAFFIVGGLLTEGELCLRGLLRDDLQADRKVVSVLERLGAEVSWNEAGELELSGPFRPDGFTVDAADCPDLVPILAVLGAFARGKVVLENISHLSNKESDRLSATAEELSKTAARAKAYSDRLVVTPSSGGFSDRKVEFNAHNDHRLAMAFSILSVVRGNAVVHGARAIDKSYPDFYEHLQALNGEVDLI